MFISPPLPPQSSLCSVDLDSRVVGMLEDIPDLPDSDRLTSQLSEKVQEYSVNCPDISDLPSSPKTAPSKVRSPGNQGLD